MATMPPEDDGSRRLREAFGAIDIYLFDQLLRGTIHQGLRVLDVGCGTGRNLVYLLREGFDVTALDADPGHVEAVRHLAERLGRPLPAERLVVGSIEALPFDDGAFDVVLGVAVLHFARDEAAFEASVRELGRVLAPGGLLFTRLATSIGMDEDVVSLGHGRFRLPDGTERFLADEATLLRMTSAVGGTLADPLKTTYVQGLRWMTTWVVRKDG